MNIRLALALAIAFTGTSIFAAIPLNPIGPKEKDAAAPPRPVPLAHTKSTDWPQSLEILKAASPVSGVYYNAAMKSLVERGLIAPDVSQSLSFSSLAAISSATALKHGRLSPGSLAVPNFFETVEHNTTNGNGINPAEPTTIAANSPGGSTYTVNAWIGTPADSRIMTNYSTDRVNYSVPAQLASPLAYLDQGGFMGDPSLTVTLTDGTYTPRIYASTTAYHRANSPSGQSGVYVYGTATGGQTWEGPVEVAVSGDANVYFDQSTMTTSWATNSNTAGMKFTAYALYNLYDRNQGAIRIRRSRSPIFCFGRCRAVCPCVPSFDAEVTVATGNVASPQVAVDATGAVHVTYVRYALNVTNDPSTIEEAVSNVPADPSTENISFGSPILVAYFYLVSGSHIYPNMPAYTVPRMRYDAVADKICLTWHGTDAPGGTITQVYFASRAVVNGSWPGSLIAPIFSVMGRDLFMPALDADESGNILLGWYDRRDSNSNLEYRPYAAYISSSGGVILGPAAISSISSVPTSYFIGDYHEIWHHNYPDGARWNDAWIAHPSYPGEVYVTDIR